MLDLPFAEKDGFCVIAIPPTLDQNDWLGFRDHIHRQFLDRGILNLVLDCERCAELPSIAFGSFTSLSRDLRRMNGSLDLVHVSEKIRTVMVRTRIGQVIPVNGTLTEVFSRRDRRADGPDRGAT